MNIAVVGEGPIGAIVCLFFVYYKLNFNITDLQIYFYKSRKTFKRRHIVKVSKNMLKDIEKLINSCLNCLTHNNNNKIIDLSIRCLEYLLHKNIDSKYVEIIEKKFTENNNINNDYQHIFLCDGFASSNRLFYIYDNINYKPLRMVINTPILILYGNLDLSEAPINIVCINSSVIKKQFFGEQLIPYEIDINMLAAFISIIYNINFKYNDFNSIIPGNENMKEINLWVEGYTNYQNFIDIFNNTIDYFQQLDEDIIINIFEKNNTFISHDILSILKDKSLVHNIFEKYKNFLLEELKRINGVNNPFIIHNVMPNCTTFGIILDDSVETLVFAKKNTINNYTSWLIGDSANSYPPGVSLQNGIKDVFSLIPNFIKTEFLPDLVVPFLENSLFNCENGFYINEKTNICRKLSDFRFTGGYLFNNDIMNNKQINIHELLKKIESKKCSDDNLVNIYNNYQLNNFFSNLINYICNNMLLNVPNKGGKIKIKNKNTKRKKNNKNNKNKTKSRR